MAFQQVTVLGNLGRDVESRFTADGKQVTSFSVAVTERHGGKEHTEWFNCVTFGKTAEVAAQYLAKGAKCLVIGKLKTEKYTDKEGAEKTSVKVIVDRLSLESPKGSNSAVKPEESRPNKETGGGGFNDFEDDIPFLFNMNTLCDTLGQPLSYWRGRYGKEMSVMRANKTDY